MIRKILAVLIASVMLLGLSACRTDPPAPAGDTVATDPEPVTAGDNIESAPVVADPPEVGEEAAPEPDPVFVWEYDTPDNHGMDGEILGSLHDALDSTKIYTSVIIKDGYIIDEYYKDGYDSDSLFPLRSCSKSVTSALIGLAIDQGYIDGVDVLISEYFPQIKESDSAYLKQITIKHLLTHTSGISWSEGSGGNNFFEWRSSDNWVDYILNRPVTSAPGAFFNYSTGGSHLLAAIFQITTGRTLLDFGTEYIFEPLGMDSVQWEADPQGITDGGNGIIMNVYDMAKFGQLFLNRGRWEGEQIIPESWVAESTGVQVDRWPNYANYGYQWWSRPFGAGQRDTYFAQGAWGQLIFIVPELNLVSVFTSDHREDTHVPWTYFANYVLAACGK